MRKSTALKEIIKEAKSLKRKHPTRFNKLKKKDRWSKGYIKQASAIYASKHNLKKSTSTAKKKVGKKTTPKKRSTAKRNTTKHLRTRTNKRAAHPTAIREIHSIEKRTTVGKRPGRKRRTKRTISGTHRRTSVGKKGGSNLLLGALVGAAALYLLTRRKSTVTTTYPGGVQLPPLTQTSNYNRNTQSQDILNYAIAAGVAITTLYTLIDKLNNSTDQQVSNMYDAVNTTGDISNVV